MNNDMMPFLEISNTEVVGWKNAIRGMRNPMNSWDKSDSNIETVSMGIVGSNDYDLMAHLCQAGSDHRKFMRMIVVYVDIVGPLYWWKEFDTYKVGTVANSCSTMHKIADKPFTFNDFSYQHLLGLDDLNWGDICPLSCLDSVIRCLNVYREKYNESHDKTDWWQMIQLLPSSYRQKRTVMLNYEVLHSIYQARKNHKLDEWLDFCDWCESSLPYSELLITEEAL